MRPIVTSTGSAADGPVVPGPPAAGAFRSPGELASSSGNVPLRVPLPFLLTGAWVSALFGLLLPLVAPEAIHAPLFPHVLALVHLATLGWLTMTIMGASLQLTPVILVTQLRAARLLRWQFPVYAAGVALLIGGFVGMRPPLLAAGGIIVALAVLHYVIVLALTLAHARTRPLTARYVAAALVYLCLVVGLGLTAALNMQLHFLGETLTRLLQVHVVLGIFGWLSTTLIGVSYTLVRLFALVHGHADTVGRSVFVALNAGVVGLAAGFALDVAPLALLGGLALTAALWLFAYDYARMIRARRRKLLEVSQWHSIAGVAYLAITVPLAFVMVVAGAAQPPQLVALGLLALVGALGQSIVGYLYKIVPFLIWHARFAPLIGKAKVPLMRDLIEARWAVISFWLINLSLPAIAIATILSWVLALQLACAALGCGLALAAVNITRIVVRR